jgi:hypothetical protein
LAANKPYSKKNSVTLISCGANCVYAPGQRNGLALLWTGGNQEDMVPIAEITSIIARQENHGDSQEPARGSIQGNSSP